MSDKSSHGVFFLDLLLFVDITNHFLWSDYTIAKHRLQVGILNKFCQITDYKEITDNGKRIIMSHYPIMFYRSSYGNDVWHFCGHTHNRTAEEYKRKEYVLDLIKNRKQDFDNKGHIINVGCMMDYMGYTPRTADELIDWWNDYYKSYI